MAKKEINTRCKYNARFTNSWLGPFEPVFRGIPLKLTPRQILDEYEELKRVSGGCYCAAEIFDSDGNKRSLDEIRHSLPL